MGSKQSEGMALSVMDINDVQHAMEMENLLFDIKTSDNGQVTWVHGPDGSCVGRFDKRFGIDVHTTATDQMNGKPQCLLCTHEEAGLDAWHVFRAAIKTHHNIDIPEDAMQFDASVRASIRAKMR